MSPNTKESQRAELQKTIWRIANDLRGSVDGWDFKTYVLGMLFYRFISENLAAYLDRLEREAGEADFEYIKLSDKDAEFGRKDTVDEKGFYILPSELFVNVRKRAATDENLNETLARVFKNIEGSALGTDSEDDLRGLFDDLDVNSAKLGQTVAKRNEKLVKLLEAIGDLDLGSEFTEHTIDAFGDAYEYLMTMYASSAGKSGGEFFTPQEVSELLARITVVGKTQVNKVYDPACGSGSLLLKFAKVLGREHVRKGFFGQEINLTTYSLARINMFLHDINYEQFDIAHGDTLIDPAHWDEEPFEAIVSNPPYSVRWDGDTNPLLINDPRFTPAGVLAPRSRADLAFTMHILSWLAVNGTAAIVEFPGVFYRPGAEKKIRQYLIDNNFVDTIIKLPINLFFGTTISTCILVLKKSKSDNDVLFIDASDQFVKNGNKNSLTLADQKRILSAFSGRENVADFAIRVSHDDIELQGYNLDVSTYLRRERVAQDVDATQLDAEIEEIVERQTLARVDVDEYAKDAQASTSEIPSSVEDLLTRLCPEGIQYDDLDHAIRLNFGMRITRSVDSGTLYPVYGGGGESFRTDNYNRENEYVISRFAMSATCVRKVSEKFWMLDSGFTFDPIDADVVDKDFVAYVLFSMQPEIYACTSQGAQKNLKVAEFRKLQIPLPPIEIQQEVVRILDSFVALEDELQAELTARRLQYESFRSRLFRFNGVGDV